MTNDERLYTARWCFRSILKKTTSPEVMHLATTGIAHLTAVIGDGEVKAPQAEPTPTSSEPALWHPNAVKNHRGKMKTNGKYKKGWPEGLIVHYDAGAGSPESPISTALKKGYCFFTIAKDGTLYQNAPANEWGSHAGRSKLAGLFDTVSDDLAGVEVCCAGKLDLGKDGKLRTHFGRVVEKENARYSEGKENIRKGWYEKFTPEQEAALLDLVMWLKSQKPSVFQVKYVRGHDEVSLSGKTDPGASLSMSMPNYREFLKSKGVT